MSKVKNTSEPILPQKLKYNLIILQPIVLDKYKKNYAFYIFKHHKNVDVLYKIQNNLE